jgi:hypothetical protein
MRSMSGRKWVRGYADACMTCGDMELHADINLTRRPSIVSWANNGDQGSSIATAGFNLP